MHSGPLKVLLLENIHATARDLFIRAGYTVDVHKDAMTPGELKKAIQGYQVLGIRSKTRVTAEVFEGADRLIAMGCFCIGTNQVDLEAAKHKAIAVFNAPYSNTRSVAEMILGEIIMLARQLGQRTVEMHQSQWNKKSDGCYEVRGKTLGIVGYGNIGSQLSTLAEALGMRVLFYDVISKLSLGNAKPVATLADLLRESDFVTLHVPATPLTHGMIGTEELRAMKKGSFLINASRGTVVDISALQTSLQAGHLAGAAIDVYPEEPVANTKAFQTPLQGLYNVILTPHIGGATEEAQGNIGREVAANLIRHLETGSTQGSVNFPILEMHLKEKHKRIINTHANVPGVMREVNRILSEGNCNILGQMLATEPDIGHLLIDLEEPVAEAQLKAIQNISASIRTRTV